jgi:chromosome segregation ATPase
MLNLFRRWAAVRPPTLDTTDLLSTLRANVPDPAALRAALDDLTRQIEAADAEWERLDRRGDAAAYLQLQPLAQRLQELRAQASLLPDQIAEAERRRDTFVQLAVLFEDVRDDAHARLCALLEHPPQDERERNQQLRALDQATKLHVRFALRLHAVSTDRRFREPPDAIAALRDDVQARVRELDRLRLPGMKQPVAWSSEVVSLLDILESRTHRKEIPA